MHFNLKQIALAGLLTCLGASAMAANYFFVTPKSMEMPKVAPFNVALEAYSLPGAVVGLAYSGTGFDLAPLLVISGDTALNKALATFAVTSGTLPAGLTLSTTGVISGIPVTAGSGNIQVTASYKNASGARAYTVVSANMVVTLAATTLPSATVGQAYNGTGFDFASLLTAPADPAFNASLATFALTSGTMPAGMALSQTGKLTGTPTAASASTTLQVAATYKSNTGAQNFNWVAIAAGPTDPNIAAVTFLMHADGLTGSTTFTDSKGNSITGVGAAKLSTSRFKAGTASVALNGTSDYLRVNNGAAAFSFGTGDFTIETWIYLNAAPGGAASIIETRTSDTVTSWIFDIRASRVLDFLTSDTRVMSTQVVPVGAWTHVAVTRSSGVIRLFVNGTMDSATGTSSADISSTSATPIIGAGIATGVSYFLNANLDEMRLTKGLARYTANFSVPTAAFPDQ